jgi:hypothetical protein
MRLAIADPPYYGRANRYYGSGSGGGGGNRKVYKPDYHPEAHIWDTKEAHYRLVEQLNESYDSWVIAMSSHNLDIYLQHLEIGSGTNYRVCAWIKPTSVPSGSRIRNGWEPVLLKLADSRKSRSQGIRTVDYLIANPLRSGFLGAKPFAWTHWVLDLMGYEIGDQVDDLFNGSGAVNKAIQQHEREQNGNQGSESETSSD